MSRKPLQGLRNIVSFNWPYYLLSVGSVLLVFTARNYFGPAFTNAIDILILVVAGTTLLTLIVSFYVYDLSGFYELRWLNGMTYKEGEKVANINAGFDETSSLLAERFKNTKLSVCDFYDPVKHTESSIKRARQQYPPFPGTQNVSTRKLPFESNSIEKLFTIMSAHEIRIKDERKAFFIEVRRVLAVGGQAVVVEHLRNAANLLAYNVGAFHFYSRAAWLETFDAAKLEIVEEKKITPFLTAFFLQRNGTEF